MSDELERIENQFVNAVVPKKTNKKKERKKMNKKVKHKINETYLMFFSIIISVVIVVAIILLLPENIQDDSINSSIIDEVVNKEVKSQGDGIEMKTEKIAEGSSDTLEGEEIKQTNNEEITGRHYVIQVVASKELKPIKREVSRIKDSGYSAFYITEGKYFKLLLSKKFKTRNEAEEFAENLKQESIIKDYWVRVRNEQ